MVEICGAQAELDAGPGIRPPVTEGDGVPHSQHHCGSVLKINLLPIKSEKKHSLAGPIQTKLEHF